MDDGVDAGRVEPATRTGPRGAFAVILDRNYLPYFLGNFVSASGMWFQTLAQSVLVYRLTESALYLGLVNSAQFLGVILLAPWAGPAADRFDRRRLLAVAQLGSAGFAGVLAALVWMGAATVEITVLLVLCGGVTAGLATPAMHSLVPALVKREQLPVAVALNSATFNLARAAGPTVGAITILHLGLTWAFALIAISYLALVGGLALVTPSARVRPLAPPRLRDALALVRREPRLLALMGVVAASAIAIDPVTTLGPIFAVQEYGGADVVAGYLLTAFGAGAVLAAIVTAGRPFHSPATMALRLATLGVGMAAFALAPGLGSALPALFIAGAGFLMTNAAATTRIQLDVEDEYRGRIMALWSIAFIGSRPLASLADGALASIFGVRVSTFAFALVALSAAMTFALVGLRRQDSRTRRANR